jgi:hypothetical protein
VSTRKLILAALACGVAILVAGGVLLVNLTLNRDELTVPDLLAMGEVAEVDGVRATVLGSRAVGPDVVAVRVRLRAPDSGPVRDAGQGWALVIGSARDRVGLTDELSETPCDGLEVAPAREQECDLGFAAAEGSQFVEYARGGERARWRLGR